MKLFLHQPDSETDIRSIYHQAFKESVELYVVTAYLTDWDNTLILSEACKHFRIIIGKDFGITKKSACFDVLKWLPSHRKSQFMVADDISGFHPKAIFWKDNEGTCHSLIGSSNLTKAAFSSNYEANIYTEISLEDYTRSVQWVKSIEKKSVIVSEDWLDEYQEAKPPSTKNKSKSKSPTTTVKPLTLPKVTDKKSMKTRLKERREQLKAHAKVKDRLHQLFEDCRSGTITSLDFYEKLPEFWGYDSGNRLQGAGWERRGKSSNFKELAECFFRILNSPEDERDDTVVQELDLLKKNENPSRQAFFTEILCLSFPDLYPIVNKPVEAYLKDIKFRAPKGSSEGSKYLDLAKKLRVSLLQNPELPAKNLAELDTIIWLVYHEE